MNNYSEALEDDTPKRERWLDFTVSITLKHNLGSFGIRREYLGEFRFCAKSRAEAVTIAGLFTKDESLSIDTQKLVEIVGSVPVPWEEVELAQCQRGTRRTDMSIRELSGWIDELEAELV